MASAFDSLIANIGAALEADRTLGGLCDWVEPEAPDSVDLPIEAAAALKAGVITVVLGAVRRMRTSLQYPYPALGLGRQKAAPLGESGGTGQLVVVSVLEMALRRKVVVHRGMD